MLDVAGLEARCALEPEQVWRRCFADIDIEGSDICCALRPHEREIEQEAPRPGRHELQRERCLLCSRGDDLFDSATWAGEVQSAAAGDRPRDDERPAGGEIATPGDAGDAVRHRGDVGGGDLEAPAVSQALCVPGVQPVPGDSERAGEIFTACEGADVTQVRSRSRPGWIVAQGIDTAGRAEPSPVVDESRSRALGQQDQTLAG